MVRGQTLIVDGGFALPCVAQSRHVEMRREERVLALAHEPLAGGADERHRLGEEDAHRVSERAGLLVPPPVGCICFSAAAVSSTAVLSVSVANCSRCASLTLSDWVSANSRSPRRISSGSPPNGKKPPPSIPWSVAEPRCARRARCHEPSGTR